MRIGWVASGVVVLAVLTTGCPPKGKGSESGKSGGDAHPLARQVAPDVTLKLQKGGSWHPGDASGKVLLIDFWATWCGPCKDSFPKLEGLKGKYEGKGLEVVGVNEDEDGKGISSFLTLTGATFTIALDPAQDAGNTYGVQNMPTEFLIDRKGVVRFVHAGYHSDSMDELDAEIQQLLSEPP